MPIEDILYLFLNNGIFFVYFYHAYNEFLWLNMINHCYTNSNKVNTLLSPYSISILFYFYFMHFSFKQNQQLSS
jgi:hypothetical protein